MASTGKVSALLDLLSAHGVSLVLPAIYTMPEPARLFRGPRPVTSDLVYVRFLGHHREMDALVARLQREGQRTGEWSELALDRSKGETAAGNTGINVDRRQGWECSLKGGKTGWRADK